MMNTANTTTPGATPETPADAGVVNHISEIRLRLPEGEKYIQLRKDLPKDEVVEQVVFFEDIYPTSIETITDVSDLVKIKDGSAEHETYIITCAGSDFIPSKHMRPGQTLQAVFQSGILNGQTFRVTVDEDYLPGGRFAGGFNGQFKIIPNYITIGDLTKGTPNKEVKPERGEQFVLTGISLPEENIKAAERELERHGMLWAREHSSDTDVYTCQTDPVYCAEHNIQLSLGQRIRLMDEGRFGPEGRASRIQEFEKSLADPYKATYTIGDNTPYSRLGSLESTVQKSQFELLPGAGGGRGVYLIQSKYDLTPPTDNNAYSAAATETVFLSKNAGGTVKAPVRFEQDVAASGDVVSSDFHQDALAGSGFGIYRDANGARVLEIDKVRVRKELEVNELVVNQVTHVGGRQIYSAAGMEVAAVETIDGGYRCYMDTRQGQRINRFKAGDQAYCLQYNPGQTEVTKYYWRLVTAVGDDHIDLSASDADGDGVPQAGDNIAQVGHRTDPNRQSMYEIDQTAGGAVTQYAAIDAFTFEGKNCIGQYYDSRDAEAKLYAYGETYIGDREQTLPGANFITYQKAQGDDRKRLYVSAQMRIGSGSEGLANLSEWSEAQSRIDAAADAARSANQIVGAIQGDIDVLRRQIDGQIECWFKDYNPTLTNQPASDWPDEVKRQMHEGDTFTNLVSGYSWRWTHKNNVWSWEQMDAASARALASASAAEAALDGRCAVFLRTPLETDRYEVGDLWMNATFAGKYSDELLRATTAKAAGAPFSIDHWAPATKYTDDSAVEALRQEVTESVQQLDQALAQINADDVFTANEKHQIRTLWENINGIAGFDHPEDLTAGSYAQVLAAAAGQLPQPQRAEAFRTADSEEFMVQKA